MTCFGCQEIRSYPEFNERDEKIPQLMVLTSKQILDKADQAKAKPQPFLMFECSVCTKILNTQTMAAKVRRSLVSLLWLQCCPRGMRKINLCDKKGDLLLW